MTLPAPNGRWWLACGDDGVWPCDVLSPSVWPGYVVVKPTHDAAPDAWQQISVSSSRVYDNSFNHPSWSE